MLHTNEWRENDQEEDLELDGQTKLKKDLEMRGGNQEEIQENRKWENRDGLRFLCNSQPIPLKQLKNADNFDIV